MRVREAGRERVGGRERECEIVRETEREGEREGARVRAGGQERERE